MKILIFLKINIFLKNKKNILNILKEDKVFVEDTVISQKLICLVNYQDISWREKISFKKLFFLILL